ncbi:superoxide dismutase family protein [Sphingomonas flavescens]|uniref:superoxide dismutase family protein n=1 Tax=Sphingomonas flavescens TaxID=3132797 RepID=UPI003B20F23A
MRYGRILLGTAAIAFTACSRQPAGESVRVSNQSAAAFQQPADPFGWPILDVSGRRVGTIFTKLAQQGVIRVSLDTAGLPPGAHGVHIHEVAKCEGPNFESAGAHWNWSGKKHGHANPSGHHAGDLGNLIVGVDGRGQETFSIDPREWDPKANGPLSLVIHASEDDERSDPSGNSGARIACGTFYLRRHI